jgi:RimJ/RimL family protein N-acetyltransferase
VVTTPRLVLRTFRRDDLSAYAALNADPKVYVQLGGEPLSREHSDEIAAWAQQCYEAERLGLLAVERRSDGEFLGMCGLHHQESHPDEVEIAWRFASQHWGHGYATEAARGWLRYGFTVLGLPRVISMTDHDNVRSIAVMQRLGMTFVEATTIVDDGQTFDAVLYELSAKQWAEDNQGGAVEEFRHEPG